MKYFSVHRIRNGVQSVFAPVDCSDPVVGKTIGNITAVAKDCDMIEDDCRSYYICECSIHNTIFRMRRDKFMAGNLGCTLCANRARALAHTNTGVYGGGWGSYPKLYEKWYNIRRKCVKDDSVFKMYNEWRDNFLNFANWAISKGYVEDPDRNFSIEIIPGNTEYNPNTTIIVYK